MGEKFQRPESVAVTELHQAVYLELGVEHTSGPNSAAPDQIGILLIRSNRRWSASTEMEVGVPSETPELR